MTKLVRVYYGNIVLIKKHCPDCRAKAFIIQNKFSCCGRSASLEQDVDFKLKRESIVPGFRNNSLPLKTKKKILAFQNYQCIYCGISLGRKKIKIEYDHFIPFCSGEDGNDNFVASCRECNRIKHCLLFNSIDEARVHIFKEREQKGLSNFDYFGGSYVVTKI